MTDTTASTFTTAAELITAGRCSAACQTASGRDEQFTAPPQCDPEQEALRLLQAELAQSDARVRAMAWPA